MSRANDNANSVNRLDAIHINEFITSAQELEAGSYELGASNTYTLPESPGIGTTISVRRLFGFTPIVSVQGSNDMTYPKGTTDTTTTINVDFTVGFVWNGSTWEVK